MYNQPTVLGKTPDFTNVKRKNMGYDNVFGAKHNTNHPSWETGGDYAAVARQSFTTPGMEQRYQGVTQDNVQGYITKLSGQNGTKKMTRLYGQDDFSSRRHKNPYSAAIDLNKQISLANKTYAGATSTQQQGSMLILFLMICFLLYFMFQ